MKSKHRLIRSIIAGMLGRVMHIPEQDVLLVARKLGARQTLRKPFTPAQLGAALAQANVEPPAGGKA